MRYSTTSSGTTLHRSPVTTLSTDWMPTSCENGVAEIGWPSSSRTRTVSSSTSGSRSVMEYCASWAFSVPVMPPGRWCL